MDVKNYDTGYVIKDKDGLYFIGYNQWDSQLRKAHIYHSERMANEVMSDTRKAMQHEGKHLVLVEIKEKEASV